MPRSDALLLVLALTLIAFGVIDYVRTKKIRILTIPAMAIGAILGLVVLLVRRWGEDPNARPVPIPPPSPRQTFEVGDRALATEAERAASEVREAERAPSAYGADEVAEGLARHVRPEPKGPP